VKVPERSGARIRPPDPGLSKALTSPGMIREMKELRVNAGMSLDEAREYLLKTHIYKIIDEASTLEEIKDILKVLVFKNKV